MKPNVLYIHSHDTGRYIQPFGHQVTTPNLQSLAEEGVLFRSNHCICPTCSPSRSALLTGTYPHENGMLGLAHRGFSLTDYSQHMAQVLGQNGYATALSGVQHVASRAGANAAGFAEAWQQIGYDEYLANGTEAETGAAEWIRGRGNSDGPFFLAVGFFETHRVFPDLVDEDDEDPRYTLPPAPLPDTPQTRLDMARYRKMARELDRKIGVVLQALRETGLYENTLVIATTDHGIAFPRMKCNLQDSGTGTFLIMRAGAEIAGGTISGGKVVDAVTTHMDIFPTVLDAIGADPISSHRGSSLLPLLAAGADAARADALHDAIYGEVTYHAAYEPMRSVRTLRYKYIRRYDGRMRPVLSNVDNGPSKSEWLDMGWSDAAPPDESLFDLALDPNETNNLAFDPDSFEILEEMRLWLDRHLDETDDPIRNGAILPPAGAMITSADSEDPAAHIAQY